MRILLALLVAVVVPSLALGAVDSAKRNEEFKPKASDQPRVEKDRTEVGEAKPERDGEVQFVTVPATSARVSKPKVVDKERAPLPKTADTVPSRKPQAAAISTAKGPPEKFDRKYETTSVARIQESMGEANRVKSAKTKAAAKPSVLQRINRFVFHKNEPPPATTPAGGENAPAGKAPAESSSDGS